MCPGWPNWKPKEETGETDTGTYDRYHSFFIDDDTLTMAVRHCLFFKLGPTRQNVMKAIRDTVRNNGRSILDFPEAWGEDLMDVSSADVENAMKKLRPLFGL